MRKAFFAMCLLAILSVGGLAAAHVQLSSSAKEISFQETTLAGDPAAAEGFTADLSSEYSSQLFFDTHLAFGQGVETDFTFIPRKQRGVNMDIFPVTTSVILEHSWAYLGGIPQLPDDLPLEYINLLTPLAEETPADTTLSRTVNAADYISSLPIGWHIVMPHQYLSDNYEEANLFFTFLRGAFQYPVPEELQVKLSVTRNQKGDLTQCSVEELSPALEGRTVSCINPQSVYFIPQLFCDDQLVASHPMGRGVYRLPCTEEPLTGDDLKLLCLLKDSETVLALDTDEHDEYVFLVLRQEEQLTLRILDAQSGQVLQNLPLWAENTGRVDLLTGENCVLAAGSENQFRLFALEDGLFVPQFDGQLPTMEGAPTIIGNRAALSFDGQRMAVLSDDPHHSDMLLSLAVLDDSGLLYCGSWYSSLNSCVEVPLEGGFPAPLCRYTGVSPIHIRAN